MERTIRAAIANGVQVGAHPGFPDLSGFGRRKMHIPPNELKAIIKYQLAAIMGMAESLGTSINYIKPHGALYNMVADDGEVSKTLIDATQETRPGLPIMGLAGSVFQDICHAENVPFVAEAFADRQYEPDGRLRSRSLEGAVHADPEVASQQVLDIVINQHVAASDGSKIPLTAS